jgi:hypothetical protein
MDAVYVLAGVTGVAVAYVLMLVAAAVIGARMKRTVSCPADGERAEIRTDARHAARSMFTGEAQRVTECSLWPERRGCDRACQRQLSV